MFAWKASKFTTHWKRLGGKSRSSLALIEERLKILGPKVRPVPLQLPPRFEADAARLKLFLDNVQKSAAPTDALRLIAFLPRRLHAELA